MPICSVIGCANRSYKKSKYQLMRENDIKISFHKFPKDPVRRQQWLHAINRKGWTPTFNSVVCSDHFKPSHFDRTSKQTIRLRENAVPAVQNHHKLLDSKYVFNFAHSISVSDETPILEVTFDEDSIDSSEFEDDTVVEIVQKVPSPALEDAHTSTVLLESNELNEIKTNSENTHPVYASKEVIIKKMKDMHYIHKIRMLQQIIQKQKKKIITLRGVLNNLRHQNFPSNKESFEDSNNFEEMDDSSEN